MNYLTLPLILTLLSDYVQYITALSLAPTVTRTLRSLTIITQTYLCEVDNLKHTFMRLRKSLSGSKGEDPPRKVTHGAVANPPASLSVALQLHLTPEARIQRLPSEEIIDLVTDHHTPNTDHNPSACNEALSLGAVVSDEDDKWSFIFGHPVQLLGKAQSGDDDDDDGPSE